MDKRLLLTAVTALIDFAHLGFVIVTSGLVFFFGRLIWMMTRFRGFLAVAGMDVKSSPLFLHRIEISWQYESCKRLVVSMRCSTN